MAPAFPVSALPLRASEALPHVAAWAAALVLARAAARGLPGRGRGRAGSFGRACRGRCGRGRGHVNGCGLRRSCSFCGGIRRCRRCSRFCLCRAFRLLGGGGGFVCGGGGLGGFYPSLLFLGRSLGVERALKVCGNAAKFAHSLAQGARDIGQAFGAEHNEGHHQDDQ